MNIIKKKWKELVYSMSTEDHYAEYDPNDSGNFNMARRANEGNGGIGASRIHLTSTDGFGDEEMNIGMDDTSNDINIDEFGNTDQEGVSETLLAWRHIESWTTEHSPDLNASFGDPCTENDITHAEEDLEITFPASVKVSLRMHDGQEDLESMTGVSGLIYGLQLMTLDQIVEMTQKWRSVARNLNKKSQNTSPTLKQTQSSSEPIIPGAEDLKKKQFKLSHIPTQNSIPKDTIQPVYAHPAWIPLVTDRAGNHIGVDLAPAEAGKYAQVIIFGRDFDTKFVVAENWGDFLLSFANDLEAGNWYLIDDSDDFFAGDGDLVFRDKKSNGLAQDYLEVLKRRTWLKTKATQNDSAVTIPAKEPAKATIVEMSKNHNSEQELAASDTQDDLKSLELTNTQEDDAATKSEENPKDLEVRAADVTKDAQGGDEASDALPEQKAPVEKEEEPSKDLTDSLEKKLKIDNAEIEANDTAQASTSEESPVEDKDLADEKKKKDLHKEEFENVIL